MNHLKTLIAATAVALAGSAHAGVTLDAIQKKGFIQCGAVSYTHLTLPTSELV